MVKESSKALGVLQNISNDAPGVKDPGRGAPGKKAGGFTKAKNPVDIAGYYITF